MKKDLSFRDCLEDSHAVKPEDDQEGRLEAEFEGLIELARDESNLWYIPRYCRENGLDPRDGFEFLSRWGQERDLEAVHELYGCEARFYIRIDDILDGDLMPGVEAGRVLTIFDLLHQQSEQYENGWISYDDATRWPTVKPQVLSAYREIMRRLVRAMKDAVINKCCPPDKCIDDPTSDFVGPTPEDIADALINDPDEMRDGLGVYLELNPGDYKHVPCKYIVDMAESLEAGRDQVAPTPDINISEDAVMHGIAKDFGDWFSSTNDEVLSYIIKHHALPPGVSPVLYKGNGADAYRFWKNVGMQADDFNRCFETFGDASKKIKSKNNTASGKHKRKLDDEARRGIYKGIYIPLAKYELIKSE